MKIKLKDLETTLDNIYHHDKTFRYSLKMANKKTVAVFMMWYTSYPGDVIILRNVSLNEVKQEIIKRTIFHEINSKLPPMMSVMKSVYNTVVIPRQSVKARGSKADQLWVEGEKVY